MDEQLTEISRRLDLLGSQVQYLTEQAELAARQRAERAELRDDLEPILADVFRLTAEQLEEVQSYVDLSDVLRLAKRLVRNVRSFERMLDQLESLMDLVETLGPLADGVFEKAVGVLEAAERKGYFTFVQRGVRLADSVVVSANEFSPPARPSLRGFMTRLRDPDVQRGLALLLDVMAAVGVQAAKCAEEAAAAAAGGPTGPCAPHVPAAAGDGA